MLARMGYHRDSSCERAAVCFYGWVLPEEDKKSQTWCNITSVHMKDLQQCAKGRYGICSWKRCSSRLILNYILLDDTDIYFTHSWSLRWFKDRINQVWYNFDFFFLSKDVQNMRNDSYWKSHGKRKKRLKSDKNPKLRGFPCLVIDSTVKVRDYLPLEI